MDIFNKTPHISNDALHYVLYPLNGGFGNDALSAAALLHAFANELTPGLIWHRDPFEVNIATVQGFEGWVLEGQMRVGDCVDDEWCVVWLLREISRKWDFAISVSDSDGEFLLIEAADVLPSWVNPDNAKNRVWIYRSHLHLISLMHVSPPPKRGATQNLPVNDQEDGQFDVDVDDDGYLSIRDALKLLCENPEDAIAPREVEGVVWNRISGYPAQAQRQVHVARAYVPLDICKVLSKDPPLVQRAVEAFYTRDALQLRSAHRMTRFPPNTSVLASVRLTRAAYAQLLGQKFHPPKIFGSFKEPENSKEWKWRDIGMKIACGFEMLFQESKAQRETLKERDQAAQKDSLRRDPEYNGYIENLTEAGYFRGEVQGSNNWNGLEEHASRIFVQEKIKKNTTRPPFALEVNQAILAVNDKTFEPPLYPEEPDDWMTVDSAAFESDLSKGVRPGAQQVPSDTDAQDQVAEEQAEKLRGLATKIESFVDGEGTYEGVVFDDDTLSDEELSSDSDEEQPATQSTKQTQERQAAMDSLVPGIDASEYGKLPAWFNSNSQKVAPVSIDGEPQDINMVITGKQLRKPMFLRDQFDGVDSDDESGGEGDDDDASDEDPQVVGDVEIDMSHEEEEFLEFSREALGISDEMWREILRDRKERGAFLPNSTKRRQSQKVPANFAPSTDPHTLVTPPDKAVPGNRELDSFEAVMQAMDNELARVKASKASAVADKDSHTRKGKGKAVERPSTIEEEEEDEEEDEDTSMTMDDELRAALKGAEDPGPLDYNLIANFLESFKSQAGLPGPVSALAGRLEPGWTLPRDNS